MYAVDLAFDAKCLAMFASDLAIGAEWMAMCAEGLAIGAECLAIEKGGEDWLYKFILTFIQIVTNPHKKIRPLNGSAGFLWK